MALTTLLTLLTRLSERGFIKIEKASRSARYYPLINKQEYLAEQSKRKEDIAELRDLLERDAL